MATKQDMLVSLSNELSSELKTPVTRSIKNRVAYIVSHGASYASNGYAVRTQGVAKALNGHGFETLCMVRPGRPWELDEHAEVGAEVIVDGVKYIHTGKDKNFIASKAQEHLKQSAEYFRELFYVYRPEYVIAASDFKIGLPALVAAKQLGIPFFNEVRGFWEMSRVAREPEYETTNSYKRQIERDTHVAQQSTAVFTLSETMKKELAQRGVDNNKIHLLPNGVSELPEIREANSELRSQLGIQPDDKVVGFIGSINAYEGLDTLLSACQRLIDKGQKIKLLLVGDSQPLDSKLGDKHNTFSSEDNPWLIQVGRVPHEKVGDYYSLVDAIVIPRKRLPVCETVPPMKAAEALAYGKPLIVSDVAAMKEYSEQYAGVQAFEADNSNALANIISKLPARTNVRPYEISIGKNAEIVVKILKDKFSKETLKNNTTKNKKQKKQKVDQGGVVSESTNSQNTKNIEPAELLKIESEFKLPTKDPVWHKVKVSPGQKIIIRAKTKYLNIPDNKNRKAVLLINSFDRAGKLVDKGFGKLAKSGHLNAYFKYLACTDGLLAHIHDAVVPPGIFELAVGCCGFNQSNDEQVLVKELNINVADDESSGTKFVPPSRQAAEISLLGWPEPERNNKPLVIGIMDEFTTGCFEFDINLIQPRADNWFALAEKYKPQFFFIESAWQGNYGSWQYRVANYANKPGQEIAHICQYAQQKGIPTLFWNKEDPVHHDKFMCSAELVDHIFTTDANMKSSYIEKTGNRNVHALPFAAQPTLHKPAGLGGRHQRACFAGSWYGNRHAERGEAMRWLLQAANAFGLDIYDRNFGTGVFPFPEEYQAGIKGSLPYKKLCEEYNRYRVFLNVNSVTDSPTMFSRRVFELMACGTPVVSTYARGIEELFESDAVWLVKTEEEAQEAMRVLMTDDKEWRRRSLAGIREVFSGHTYAHRLNQIFETLGLETQMNVNPKVKLLAFANGSEEYERLITFAESQEYQNFDLGIISRNRNLTDENSVSGRVVNIEENNLQSWLDDVDSDYVGWICPGMTYGEYYLRDLINASMYEPSAEGWGKSLQDDTFSYGEECILGGTLWKKQVFCTNYLQAEANVLLAKKALYQADAEQFIPGNVKSISSGVRK